MASKQRRRYPMPRPPKTTMLRLSALDALWIFAFFEGGCTLTLWLFNSSPWEMAHRNRWFTVLKNGGSFQFAMLVITRYGVITTCATISWPSWQLTVPDRLSGNGNSETQPCTDFRTKTPQSDMPSACEVLCWGISRDLWG